MRQYPKVIVLTLNWNTKEMTAECINSVLESDYPNFEVVVIDNGSSDGSERYFRKTFKNHAGIHIIQSGKNLGYANGMNYGLEYALRKNPDYFFIMNNDTILDSHAISVMINVSMKYKNQCLVTGKVYDFNNKNVIQLVGYEFINRKYLISRRIGAEEEDAGQYDHESERDMIDDIFMLMPFDVFKSVGGYSPYFFMNYEQADLALRVIRHGYKLIYTPGAKIWHKGSYSTGGRGNPAMLFWDTESRMIYYYRNLPFPVFMFQYIATFKTISIFYLKAVIKTLVGGKPNFKCINAQFRGLLKFTGWLIITKNKK